jgi:hypothetical protein
MTDPRDPRTRLLADSLHDDWAAGPGAALARRAAAHARHRRTGRRVSLSLVAAAMLAIGFTLSRPRLAREIPAPPSVLAAAPAPVGYELISDDELFSLLRNESLLVLPQADGTEKIVLLDR